MCSIVSHSSLLYGISFLNVFDRLTPAEEGYGCLLIIITG